MWKGKIVKFGFVLSGVLAFLYIIASNFFGPGAGDYSESLINGYSYVDAGHFEKTINYTDDKGKSIIVIDARVDDFKEDGVVLFVARHPREVFQEDGITKSRLSFQCEYLAVNTTDHSVKQIDNVVGLSCK